MPSSPDGEGTRQIGTVHRQPGQKRFASPSLSYGAQLGTKPKDGRCRYDATRVRWESVDDASGGEGGQKCTEEDPHSYSYTLLGGEGTSPRGPLISPGLDAPAANFLRPPSCARIPRFHVRGPPHHAALLPMYSSAGDGGGIQGAPPPTVLDTQLYFPVWIPGTATTKPEPTGGRRGRYAIHRTRREEDELRLSAAGMPPGTRRGVDCRRARIPTGRPGGGFP
ncbi:hypothetical protein JHW43_002093 [Diplocarpon mali]|nr:hypothetical protein JHW43_002093 [Diplocarpon mali]